MIDLRQTRAALLAEIEAPERFVGPVRDITRPRVSSEDAYVRLHGHTREALFPLLRLALSERFAAVPRQTLIRDLLMPLKHALGNACKHGNARDTEKMVTVEVMFTSKGALIAVTDEGEGFDVDLAVQRMQGRESYFVHHGSGFRGLERSLSPVTWEDGGRTLLLCFRPSSSESDESFRDLTRASPVGGADDLVLRRLLDPAWMRTCLASELPTFQNRRASLESCRPYLGRGPAGDDCGIRYVLRVESPERPAQTQILIGRIHDEEATAAADFEAAVALHDAQAWKGLRIPEPVARLKGEPRVVLYDFDPWMNLWQYLTYRGSEKALRHSAARVGRALATFHRSRPALHLAEAGSVEDRFLAMVGDAESALEKLPGGADLVRRFRVAILRFRARASVRRPGPRAAIHGELGWDCIHYGVEGMFYFYRFETCQISDPGIDLGGFAADLLRFAIARHDLSIYRACEEDLLASYNATAQHAMEPDELPFYSALAIGERVRDSRARASTETEHLLAALDAVGSL